MKLTIRLNEHAVEQLKIHRAALAAALAAHTSLAGELESLRATEAQLPAEIAALETRAKSGLDAEAARALAGKREQVKLLAANIAQKERAGVVPVFQTLRAAVLAAHEFVGQIGRAQAEQTLRDLTDFLEPHYTSRGFARQTATQAPSYRYLIGNSTELHPLQTGNLSNALAMAEKLERQIETTLGGGDFLPDLKTN